jgi:hypothetical protein
MWRHDSAFLSEFVMGVLVATQTYFRDGRCVEVRGAAPANAAPGATVPVEVSTFHKLDGAALAVAVDATLTGAGSIDPARLDPTPATLIYTAGSDPGDAGTIALVSTSRRGIGRASVTITVDARRYRVSGGGSGLTVSGEVGDLSQPFTIEGEFPGAAITFTFTPTDDRSGTVTGSFSGSGVTGTVEGPYTITGEPGGPLVLRMTTSGCVEGLGGGCRTNESVIDLTPL